MSDITPVEELKFEAALAELESIVSALERGDVPLEETIARFERGVSLSRRCEDRLDEAERKVAMLLQQGSRVVEVDLRTGEELGEIDDPGDLVEPAPTARRAPATSKSHAESEGLAFAPPPDDDDIPF